MARLILWLVFLVSSTLLSAQQGQPCGSRPVVYCKVPRHGPLPIPTPPPAPAPKKVYYRCPTDIHHDFYVGEATVYTQLKFNNPSQLHGCLIGGVVGLESQFLWGCYGLYNHIFGEGYWNASRISGSTCQRSSVNEYLVDWHLGWIWQCSCFSVIPYSGFGYDSYKNRQDPQAHGLSYRFEKLFIPLGLKLTYRPARRWEVALEGEGRFDVSSSIDVLSRCVDAENNVAWRVQLPVTYTIGRLCGCVDGAVKVTPYYDWSRYGRASGHSTCHLPLPIPSLRRWMAGCQFSLLTRF